LDGAPRKSERQEWFDPFARPLMDLASTYLLQDDARLLLDMGCGRGHRTSCLCSAGRTIVGSDLAHDHLVQACSERKGLLVVEADSHHLPFRYGSLDGIFSFSTLQYLDWRTVAKQCYDLLKPGGRAVFIENLAGNPLTQLYRTVHRLAGWQYGPFQTPRNHIPWDDLRVFSAIFDEVDFSGYHLTTPLALAWPALCKNLFAAPMRAPVAWLFRGLWSLDRLLVRSFPSLERRSWLVIIRVHKRAVQA